MNDPWALIGLLVLISGVGAAAFFAGYRSAAAYLPAARAVSDVARQAVEQSNSYVASLDKSEAALSSLQGAIETQTKTISTRQQATEDAIINLFQGLESAGLARSPRSRTGPRQTGDPEPA